MIVGSFSKVFASILFILSFASLQVHADLSPVDSLKLVLHQTSDAHKKVILLNRLSNAYLSSNPDSAIIVGNKALELAHSLEDPELIVNCVTTLTQAYKNSALYNLGVTLIYNTLEDPNISANELLKANLLYELGVLNYASAQYDEAISVTEEALAIYRSVDDREKVSACQNQLAANYLKKENYFVAISYADSSTIIASELSNPSVLASNYEILGSVYNHLDRYDSAQNYFNRALEISERLSDVNEMANILSNIAISYFEQKDYQNAIKAGKRSFDLAQKSKIKTMIEMSSNFLAKSYAATGNYKMAYKYSEIAENMRMEMFFENRDNQISTLNRIYEFEKQKQEIANQKFELDMKERELNRKQLQNALLFAWILVMMVLLVIVNRIYRKLRKSSEILANKNLLIEDQKRKIENQAENYKNAYNKLKELDQFKEAMTHMLVHDLKNPLNVLINIPELGDFKEKDDIILHTGKQMLTLVMNMLDIQKFENDRMELNLVYIPVSKVLEAARKDVEFSATHKSISIEVIYTDDFILYIDRELIVRTLVNLLSNAIKFSPSSSTVQVRITEDDKDHVLVEVVDQGIGIELENQSLIFEKFVHLKQNSTGTMRSTGLGLTFCKMAIEAHQCEIGVLSEKDKGATFWFTLPLGLNK